MRIANSRHLWDPHTVITRALIWQVEPTFAAFAEGILVALRVGLVRLGTQWSEQLVNVYTPAAIVTGLIEE